MKLGVCVPYRNRQEHMNIFVPHVTKFLEVTNQQKMRGYQIVYTKY